MRRSPTPSRCRPASRTPQRTGFRRNARAPHRPSPRSCSSGCAGNGSTRSRGDDLRLEHRTPQSRMKPCWSPGPHAHGGSSCRGRLPSWCRPSSSSVAIPPRLPARALPGFAIDDTTKTISKTHAMLDVVGGELRVHDLHSTNGVWVVPADGEAIEVERASRSSSRRVRARARRRRDPGRAGLRAFHPYRGRGASALRGGTRSRHRHSYRWACPSPCPPTPPCAPRSHARRSSTRPTTPACFDDEGPRAAAAPLPLLRRAHLDPARGAVVGVLALFTIAPGPWLLLAAVGFSVVFTQFAFLAHDGAHRQIFNAGTRNEWFSRVVGNLFVGLSYGWWMNKHGKHHANPNKMGRDGDIDPGAIVFTARRRPRHHGTTSLVDGAAALVLSAILTVAGLDLHIRAVQAVLGREKVKHAGIEGTMLAIRLIGFPRAGDARRRTVVGARVHGGADRRVRHLHGRQLRAEPQRDDDRARDVNIDFLRRQILMSRNISGGVPIAVAMGGLNYQIEHHLFPTMPSVNLRRARPIVQEYCATTTSSTAERRLVAWTAWCSATCTASASGTPIRSTARSRWSSAPGDADACLRETVREDRRSASSPPSAAGRWSAQSRPESHPCSVAARSVHDLRDARGHRLRTRPRARRRHPSPCSSRSRPRSSPPSWCRCLARRDGRRQRAWPWAATTIVTQAIVALRWGCRRERRVGFVAWVGSVPAPIGGWIS